MLPGPDEFALLRPREPEAAARGCARRAAEGEREGG